MANIQEAFKYASQFPNSDFATNLKQLASSGAIDDQAAKFGIDLTPFKPKVVQAPGANLPTFSKDPQAASKAVAETGQQLQDTYAAFPGKISEDIQAGAADIQKGGIGNIAKGVIKSGARVAGDTAGAIFAAPAALVNGTLKAADAATNNIVGGVLDKGINYVADKISNIPAVQEFALKHPNAAADFERALNLIFSSAEKGTIDPVRAATEVSNTIKSVPGTVSDAINATASKIKTGASAVTDSVKTAATGVKDAAGSLVDTAKQKIVGNPDPVARQANLIADTEKNYAKLRKNNSFETDGGAESRNRIATANVLMDAVDESGTIRTKEPGGAVEQYKKLTLDNAEGIVRDALVQEGKFVKPEVVKAAMIDKIKSSGLEGADLKTALKRVGSEIDGMKLRANANGEIPLEIVHDSKLNQYNNIDFNTPSEVGTTRKALASALKEVVENTSGVNVKEINAELGKYLKDIERLSNLDGRKVQGGKLGKYAAQIAGNVAGAALGSVGGPMGTAAGTILGGEIAAKIKGMIMSDTFNIDSGTTLTKSKVLEDAITKYKKPKK